MMTMRVRYAPSPTGHLHIGGARTALFNYLCAHHNNGKFIIRFEDTDQSRHLESGIQNQLDGLKWLGIAWDESTDIGGPYAPYRQTERLGLYQPFIEQLIQQGDAYSCYCSEEDLELERQAQEASGEMPRYSGKCRHVTPEQAAQYAAIGRKPALRFYVPENRTLIIQDQIRGTVEFDSDGIGDYIIVRPDGLPTYNFAVVLDDLLMEITHVIRGEEHLSNTPRQLLIYQALGKSAPEFAHLPIILNQDRKKMSKRDESIIQFIEQYRELGYLPEAVVNFMALLGWSPKGEEEIFTMEQLIADFSLDRVAKSPAVFDTDKLNWMSNHYIKNSELERIVDLAIPHLQKLGRVPVSLDVEGRAWVSTLVGLYQEQLQYAAEIVDLSAMFFAEAVEYEGEGAAILKEDHAPIVLRCFLQQLSATADSDLSPNVMSLLLKNVQGETGFKGKQLFMTIRVALTGQTHGRDLNQTLFLLGKPKMMSRLQSLLN